MKFWVLSPRILALPTKVRKTPAAKLASRPLHAAPMAMPTPARRAAKLVVDSRGRGLLLLAMAT